MLAVITGPMFMIHNGGKVQFVVGISFSEDDDKIYVSDDVNFDEVRKAVSDGSMVFLDVRRPAEITDTGRIGNAFNVPGMSAV